MSDEMTAKVKRNNIHSVLSSVNHRCGFGSKFKNSDKENKRIRIERKIRVKTRLRIRNTTLA